MLLHLDVVFRCGVVILYYSSIICDMPRVILNIKNIDTIPLLPLIITGLKVNIKNILLYSENIPENIKQFLEKGLKVKVKLADSCSNYNYILEINGVNESNSKIVYKENRLLLFLNKSQFVPNDLRIQRIRQAQILTDLELDKKDCKRLTNNDWLIPLMQSDDKIGKLIKAFLTEPLPKFLRILRTKKDYAVIYDLIIQRLQTGTNTLMFSNINDFNLALVVVAIINLIYLQHYSIRLNNELECEPVFEDNNLCCKNTVLIKFDDFADLDSEKINSVNNADLNFNNVTEVNKDKSNRNANVNVDNLSYRGHSDSNTISNDPHLKLEQDKKKSIDVVSSSELPARQQLDEQASSQKRNKENNRESANGKTDDNRAKGAKNKANVVSKPSKEDKKNPLEIDVEEWALKIQEMLGS